MSEQTEANDDLLPLLRDIARPALLWAVHFIFVYAALSATCADRGLVSYGIAAVAILVVTVMAVIGAGWSIFRSGDAELRMSARWSGIISVLAIIFSAAPVLLVESCG